MEQLKVKEGKVVIDVPVKLSNELKAKITQVINEWGEYKKPKAELMENRRLVLQIDKSLANHFNKLVKEGICNGCRKTIENNEHSFIAQAHTMGSDKDKYLTFGLFCRKCFYVMADTLNVLQEFKGRARIVYYAGNKKLDKTITCPKCETIGTYKKDGSIEWNKQNFYGTVRPAHGHELVTGDRVRLPNGGKAKICSDIFVDVKKSFNVEKDEIKKGEHKIETFDIKQLSYLPAKVKFSKKKLKRVLRSLKRRGM